MNTVPYKTCISLGGTFLVCTIRRRGIIGVAHNIYFLPSLGGDALLQCYY